MCESRDLIYIFYIIKYNNIILYIYTYAYEYIKNTHIYIKSISNLTLFILIRLYLYITIIEYINVCVYVYFVILFYYFRQKSFAFYTICRTIIYGFNGIICLNSFRNKIAIQL